MDERLRQALLEDYRYKLQKIDPANYATTEEYTHRLLLLRDVVGALEAEGSERQFRTPNAPFEAEFESVRETNQPCRVTIPTLERR